jgi:large subunit ribosomal protein L24e
MPTCSFCKKNYENPRGLTLFQQDGSARYFCSSKCNRNFALKRDPKKVNWVKREKKIGKKVVKVEKSSEKKEIKSEKLEKSSKKPKVVDKKVEKGVKKPKKEEKKE